jgi:hypothetical protein
VRRVEEALIGGVGVDRGHQAVPDADRLVQHLRHRGEAVRGARGVADDVMARRVVDLVEVDAEHEGGVGRFGAFGRGGEDRLARAARDVARGVRARAEPAGGLDHDVCAQRVPRHESTGVAFREDLDPPVADDQCPVLGAHRVREAPVDGVEREEMSERVGVGDIVDGDDLELGVAFDRRAKDRTADPAEAVDGDTGGHGDSFVQWIASIASPSCASRARSLRRASCRVL